MHYREHRPRPPLGRFVECFWFVDGMAPGAPAETIVPDGCPELILHLGDPFIRVGAGGREERQDAALLVGPLSGPMRLRPPARVATMGVRFRPSGLRAFLALPLGELLDRSVHPEAIWGRAARELLEAIHGARTDEARVLLAEAFLRRLLAEQPEPDPAVAGAVAALLAERGRIRLPALAAACGLGERQLERRFRDAVGLGPKRLARVVRFQEVLRSLGSAEASAARPDWVSVALDCGYFDQAHLIRDFRDFSGQAPSRFLAADGDLSRRFMAPERLRAFFER